MTQIRGRRTGGFNSYAGTYNALFGKSDDAALYLAVIMQHIEDATSVIPVGMSNLKGASADLAREEARDWLLKPNAGFEEVCTLANVEPRDVRNAATAKIEEFERQHPEVMRDAARRKEEERTKHAAKLYEIDGEQKTLTEWAAVAGVTVATLMKRMYRKPLAEAVAMSNQADPLEPQGDIGYTKLKNGGPIAKTLTHAGETLTVKQWSERTGIGIATIGYRLRKGWTVEQALTGAPARTLTHAGKTLTVTEWAEATGIKDKTIYDRLSRGLSIEEALTP
jgi:hypothetical protein